MSFEGTSLPPPPKKQEGVLKFGHGQHEDTNTASISNDVNILSRRLRLLEEGFTNLRRYFQMAEESMLAKNKHYTAEIRTLTSDIMEVRKEIQEIRDKMFLVIKELQTVARKEDVKVLEKYINLWSPIKFVTQNEVEQIINELLEKKANRKV